MSDPSLNYFLARGVAAERAAFTPSPPSPAAGPEIAYFFYETDTGDLYTWDGSAWQQVTSGGSGITQLTGDVTAGPGSGSQAATIANDAVSNAKLANMAQSTIKGRATGAGTGDPTDLTATQATAILDGMVGDSGAGGTKGLVPAPASGDAAAGKFLKADGTWAAPSGASGDSTTTAAQASRPAAGNDGNLFLPSDGFSLQRDNGTIWQPWGPLFPFTEPVNGDFAWVNQGGASVDATKGGIFLRAPAGAGANFRIRKKSAPATPYTITACLLPVGIGASANTFFGLVFRQSSDGKLHTFAIANETSFGRIYSAKWTNETTISANYSGSPQAHWFLGGFVWLRIADDGANRICSISGDGQNWITFHSIGRTDFLTADEVGFFVSSGSASYDAGLTLLSWKQA